MTDPRLIELRDQLRRQFPTAWTGTLRELLERQERGEYIPKKRTT